MPAKKKDNKEQWDDCPDSERAKIPNINLALQDMVDPCELAKEWKVPLGQLWAFTVRDGQTGKYVNDFMIARNRKAARMVIAHHAVLEPK